MVNWPTTTRSLAGCMLPGILVSAALANHLKPLRPTHARSTCTDHGTASIAFASWVNILDEQQSNFFFIKKKNREREKSSDYFKTVLVEKDMEIMCIVSLQNTPSYPKA